MSHSFAFSTVARTVQVRLRTGADIEQLETLDKTYWLALSCPVAGLAPAGQAVAKVLDSDGDGRVRVPEVLAAVAWLKPRLASFDGLFPAREQLLWRGKRASAGASAEAPMGPEAGLPLAAIAAETPEGAPLAALFKRLLPSDERLTVAKLEAAFEAFRASPENGDGVVAPEAVETKFRPVGEAALAVTGGTPGVDGKAGLSTENLKAFAEALEAYKAWRAARPAAATLPEEALVAAVGAMRPHVEAAFRTAKLVSYNPAAAAEVPSPKHFEELADGPLALGCTCEEGIPLDPARLNPLYAAAMAPIAAWVTALTPRAESLTEAQWGQLVAVVAPMEAWQAAKPAGAEVFAALDEQVLALAGEAAVREAYERAIAADAAQAPLAAAYEDLRKLLILWSGFLRFLRNFVNTEELYPPEAGALYQVGTLYLDGRACSLCFPIDKAAAAHAAAATSSACCLVYCTLSRPSEKATRTICAVFTAGSAATLAVGRNGVFYDLEGKDWEATLVHLVANPMGLTEAFFAPWRKIAAAFTAAVHKVFAGKHEAATSALKAKAETAGKAAAAGAAPAAGAAGANGGAAMASVATLGIALSFAATAVTGLVAAITNTPLWKTALVVVGLVLVVSVPSMVLTWLKLRNRNLAPILNASGWAINRRIGLTAALGHYFTRRAVYVGKRFVAAPPMARASRKGLWMAVAIGGVAVALAAAWWWGCPTSPRQKRAAACQQAAVEGMPAAVEAVAPVVEAPVEAQKE